MMILGGATRNGVQGGSAVKGGVDQIMRVAPKR